LILAGFDASLKPSEAASFAAFCGNSTPTDKCEFHGKTVFGQSWWVEVRPAGRGPLKKETEPQSLGDQNTFLGGSSGDGDTDIDAQQYPLRIQRIGVQPPDRIHNSSTPGTPFEPFVARHRIFVSRTHGDFSLKNFAFSCACLFE